MWWKTLAGAPLIGPPAKPSVPPWADCALEHRVQRAREAGREAVEGAHGSRSARAES
jgi:hypothetical protein